MNTKKIVSLNTNNVTFDSNGQTWTYPILANGSVVPMSTWTNDPEQIVYNGAQNTFPMFLMWLRENSGAHDSILKLKKNYILSSGLNLKGESERQKILVNLRENINDFAGDLIDDYLTFGYFAVEVVFDVLGNPNSYFHIPAQMVCTNRNRTKFEVRENWNQSVEKKFYNAFNPYQTELEPGREPELFFFERQKISNGQTYSMPDYLSAVIPCLVDVEINRFNLNNIRQHFSLSTLISMYQGVNLSDAEKDKKYDIIDDLYKGATGQKYMLEFLNPNDKKTEVTNISANDWDKAYTEIVKLNSEKIQTAHSVGGMQLFGVKTPGELSSAGNSEEYQIFQTSEGNNIRNKMTSAFELLFIGTARQYLDQELDWVVEESLKGNMVSFTDKFRFMTINEIRADQGKGPIEGGDVLEKQLETKKEEIIDETKEVKQLNK